MSLKLPVKEKLSARQTAEETERAKAAISTLVRRMDMKLFLPEDGLLAYSIAESTFGSKGE